MNLRLVPLILVLLLGACIQPVQPTSPATPSATPAPTEVTSAAGAEIEANLARREILEASTMQTPSE